MQYLKQSTAITIMFGPFVDKADGVTLKTDATTITDIDHATTGIFLSKAGGTAAVRHQTVTASVADAYGMMKVSLDATDTNTVGMLDVLFAKAATYLPVHKCFMVLPANVYDALMGTDYLDVNSAQIGGADPADTIIDEVVEGSVTLRQALRLILSVLTGKSSGGGSATLVFRDIGDSKNRLSVTVDSDGNRTAVGTRDGT